MHRQLRQTVDFLVEYFSMSLLVLMTLIVSWVVFSRYALENTPAWGEEGALLCMVWEDIIPCVARGHYRLSFRLCNR